jgi:NAD(P)-dependent dehydrogenase (short-subunit alcohol dehydrogenase family)
MADSLFSLEGKTALITGGNGGLGQAIARGFRDFGARVAITGRSEAKNDLMRQELGAEISAVRDPSDDFFYFGRGLVALGPAAYTITIDATYGIVLAWTVHIQQMLGESQTLTQVQLDRPIDENAFIIPK